MATSLAAVLDLVDQLSEQEQAQVTQYLLAKQAETETKGIAAKRSWLVLEGIAADSGSGEEAQDWVNQIRDEWDNRENQWQTSA